LCYLITFSLQQIEVRFKQFFYPNQPIEKDFITDGGGNEPEYGEE
jgi:hypothetical protein